MGSGQVRPFKILTCSCSPGMGWQLSTIEMAKPLKISAEERIVQKEIFSQAFQWFKLQSWMIK